jgi:hypothetical protein
LDTSSIPKKKVLNGKFHGRRSVGRPQLRWEYIRIDLRMLDKDRDIWRRATEEAKARCEVSRHWKEEKNSDEWKNYLCKS